MSAVARNFAFIVGKQKKPIPSITQEQLEKMKADAAKYPYESVIVPHVDRR